MATVESIRRQLDVIEGMPPSMRGRYLKAIQAAINSTYPKMARKVHGLAGARVEEQPSEVVRWWR